MEDKPQHVPRAPVMPLPEDEFYFLSPSNLISYRCLWFIKIYWNPADEEVWETVSQSYL
jgi:hypothetical protein